MIATSLRTILAVSIFISIAAAEPSMKPEPNASDEAAIKRVVADFNICFNNKDAHACAMLFAGDGDLITTRGESTHGRPNLEKHYQTVFSTFLKNAHRVDTVRNVRFLNPTIASVDTEWKLTGATSPNGTEAAPPVREGLLTWIVTKRDGRWYITIFHELDFPGK